MIRPILLAWNSENQTLPSGPAASARGPLSGVGMGNSVMTPAGVILPILLPPNSPNQMFPSAPRAMARREGVGRRDRELGDLAGRGDAAHPVAGVLGKPEVAVGPDGNDSRAAVGIGGGNSVSPEPSGCIRPMRFPALSVNQTAPS